MTELYTAAALCAVGAEKALSNEIRKLGLKVDEGGFGKVRFKANREGLYRALLSLRTADRVLLETGWFDAPDFDALFEGTRKIPWENFIPANMGLRVAKVRANRSALRAETSIQAVVHKAAAERLCRKNRIERLPEGGDTAEIRVYLEKDKASLLLDLSGDPLFKRGYRIEGGIAPLRETTAAAMLLLSGWKRKFPLYDPFCGAGTIAAEAALYAWDMAPGLGRRFAIEKFLIADRGEEKRVRDELAGKVDFSRVVRIAGSDADGRAVKGAQANLERLTAPLRGKGGPKPVLPILTVKPMEEAAPPWEIADGETGYIVTNPPWGKRLEDRESAEKIYAAMAGLGRSFPGWRLEVISDHAGFESFFGKKADACREMTNGALASYVYAYEKLS